MTTTEDLLPLAAEADVPEESRRVKDLRALCKFWFADLALPEQVKLLNELRGVLAEFSPFQSEPAAGDGAVAPVDHSRRVHAADCDHARR